MDLQHPEYLVGSIYSGSVCGMPLNSATSLIQLETRSGSTSNRRLIPGLETPERLYTSTVVSDRMGPSESPFSRSDTNSHSASMAKPTLVPKLSCR